MRRGCGGARVGAAARLALGETSATDGVGSNTRRVIAERARGGPSAPSAIEDDDVGSGVSGDGGAGAGGWASEKRTNGGGLEVAHDDGFREIVEMAHEACDM